LKNYIPKSSKGYLLTLPEVSMYNLLTLTGGWENMIHTNQHSKTLQHTYYRYGAMKQQLEDLQPLKVAADSQLQLESSEIDSSANQKLIQLQSTDLILRPENDPSEHPKEGEYFKLLPNQSLSDIARKKDINLGELMRLNKIDMNNLPPPGTMIRIK